MSEANNTPKIVGGAVIAAVIVISLLFFVMGTEDSTISTTESVSTEPQAQQIETEPETTTSEPVEQEQAAAASTAFTDGTYSADTIYDSPGGNDGLGAQIVLENDQIVSFSLTREESNNTSVRWVDRFEAEVFDEVEGQDLEEADVSNLGGASLTAAAFNDLLDDIRSQAIAS